MPAPLLTQLWNVPRSKGPGSCWEGTGFFKAGFVSIGSQVQLGEQRVSHLRGKLNEPKQLILTLASAKLCGSWRDVALSPSGLSLLSCQTLI